MDYDYSYSTSSTDLSSMSPEAIMALLAGSAVFMVFALIIYVYVSLALMGIAKKTNTPNGWLAFIPIGNFYLMTQIAKVPWWTMLLVFLAWIPFLGQLMLVGLMVWWWWKICEARNKPGWWSLLIVFVPVANLIMPGILAWSKD